MNGSGKRARVFVETMGRWPRGNARFGGDEAVDDGV
jgi:hypothetical protein